MIKIPENIISTNMTPSTKLVYGLILTKKENEWYKESIENISKYLEVSVMTVRSSLSELLKRGYIEKEIDECSPIKKYKYGILK